MIPAWGSLIFQVALYVEPAKGFLSVVDVGRWAVGREAGRQVRRQVGTQVGRLCRKCKLYTCLVPGYAQSVLEFT